MTYDPLEFKILVAHGMARTLNKAVYVLEHAGKLVCSPVDNILTVAVPVRAYKALVEVNGATEIFNDKEIRRIK